MPFTRGITRKLKDGTERTYHYRVEGFREGGKVRQRMAEYLGTNPNRRTFPLDPSLAARVALALLEGKPSPAVVWDRLKGLGLDLPGRPQRVSLTYNPPCGDTLCIANDPGPLRR